MSQISRASAVREMNESLPAEMQAVVKDFQGACQVLRMAGFQPSEFAQPGVTWEQWHANIIEFAGILCDADQRTVASATTRDLRHAAALCFCPSCQSVLLGIKSSIQNRVTVPGALAHRWARQNYVYYIHALREICASPHIKHQ